MAYIHFLLMKKLACSLLVHPELVMFSFPSLKELGYRLSPENPSSANTPNLYFTHSFVNISALELRLEFLEINWRGSSIPFPVFPQPWYCRVQGISLSRGWDSVTRRSVWGQLLERMVEAGAHDSPAQEAGRRKYTSLSWTRPAVRL